MRNVINMGRGIHILKQDFFEVTITFMISSCNNMRRINSIVKIYVERTEIRWNTQAM